MSIYTNATGYGIVIFSNTPLWQGYVITPDTKAEAERLIRQFRDTFIDNSKGRDIPMEHALSSTAIELCPYVNEEDQSLFGNLMGTFAASVQGNAHNVAGVCAAAISILSCRNYFTIRARDLRDGVRTKFEAADEVALAMANMLTGKSPVETFVAMCQRDPEVLQHQKALREKLNLPSH